MSSSAAEVTELEPGHVLYLGEEAFVCANSLPVGTMLKYAEDSGEVMSRRLLLKLVAEEDHDRMWDALDNLGSLDELQDSLQTLVEGYTSRPLAQRTSSRSTSKSTRRK